MVAKLDQGGSNVTKATQASQPLDFNKIFGAPAAPPASLRPQPNYNNLFGAPAAAKPAAPRPVSPAPAPSPGISSGGGAASYAAGTPLGTNAQGQAAAIQPAAAQPMNDEDWWNQDADYQVEGAGLKNVMDTALAQLASKRSNYDTDFVSTLKNLGWDWGGDVNGSLDDVNSGHWDPTNKLGAYGNGLNGLNNDFAGRGLMDSSYYGDALTNFNTDFNNQFGSANGQRSQFLNDNGDNTGQGLAARNEYQNALARARQSSLARRDVAV